MKKLIFKTVLVALIVAGIVSCKKDEPVRRVATSIILVSGSDQQAEANDTLPDPIVAKVLDQDGNPYRGGEVVFSVSEGAAVNPKDTTGKDGLVSAKWVLGPSGDEQTLKILAFAKGSTTPLEGSPILVTANSTLIPEGLIVLSGDRQVGIPEEDLEDPIVVRVKDQNGKPLPNIKVHLSVSHGSVLNATLLTSSKGEVKTDWTLGKFIGEQSLTLKVFGADGKTQIEGSPLVVKAYTGVVDIEENEYLIASIGDQIWMTENLKTTKLNDDSGIAIEEDSAKWTNLSTPAYCWYNNGQIKNPYGVLYNGFTVNTDKLCPSGWHVPTDAEWKKMEMHLGMSKENSDTVGWRGTNEGGKLKSISAFWNAPNSGATNESGFSALPGGLRTDTALFINRSTSGFMWSSTEENDMYYARGLAFDMVKVHRKLYTKEHGLSVRCIKD